MKGIWITERRVVVFIMSLADDGYFNDLSRQPPNRSESPTDPCTATEEITPDGIARPRRIACVICRKRKLKCDGTKPSCGTCSRLGHKCAYDEVRKKSGPKRGYVKELEARLGGYSSFVGLVWLWNENHCSKWRQQPSNKRFLHLLTMIAIKLKSKPN